jgi:superfamily II RNA helicase
MASPTTLYDLLPRDGNCRSDHLLGRFLDYVADRRLTLYPAQEEAVLELYEGRNVVLNTPTGSGKSLVAAALHFASLARGRRSVYTCPIKALVNEKWLALCREFGPDNVGLSTGDATVNHDAPILCCTAEILANLALREGPDADVDDVVMDEFHWYADRDRGVAWQVPLLTLPQARFLLMSATLGDTTFFEESLTRLTGRATVSVKSVTRPVPLEYAYSEMSLAPTLERLVSEGKAPVYVVHFTQLEAAQSAQDFTSLNVCTRDEKQALARAVEEFRFSSPYGPSIRTWLKQGIGLHHAGLLPKYRVLVEQLAQRGLLKIICGTDTLGVGINVPIRTVLFTRLCKFDGQKTVILSARDFHQISGRAGRKGFDDRGWVVVQAPEHVIENLGLEKKAAEKGKKFVRRRPPEHNFVAWDRQTFTRLIHAPPERLTSRFQVSHGMLLNVLSRAGDGCRAMQRLLRDCHESDKAKAAHRRRAWQLFRSLVERKIIEVLPGARGGDGEGTTPTAGAPLAAPGAGAVPSQKAGGVPSQKAGGVSGMVAGRDGGEGGGRKLRVNVELQADFSMDQTLSLYLLETIPLVDPEQPDYALVVLSLVESILENPEMILRKQLDRLKGEAVAAMKLEGLDYDQRMEELEKLEHPKPNRDFIYATFNAFADKHPWVGQENIRPKSIAREMFESFRSFADYVRDYDLQRSEGLLLRHLNSVFKALTQTVPDTAKNDTLRDMELYLSTLIRQVDSSLLDEWEKLRDPAYQRRDAAEVRPPGAAEAEAEAAADITRDTRAFTAAIRQRIFMFLRGLVIGDYAAALETLAIEPVGGAEAGSESGGARAEPGVAMTGEAEESEEAWNAERLRVAFEAFLAGHEQLRLDPEARNLRHTYVLPAEDRRTWRVQQMLVDPEGHNDWVAEFEVDLAKSRAAREPWVRLIRLGSLS